MLRPFKSLGSTLALFLAGSALAKAEPPPLHAIAMHGKPALEQGFSHLPYANPEAPKSGRLTLALQGTFDSLNPLIVIGVAPDALTRYVLQSMMMRSADEPFTIYGLIAKSVEMPEDRRWIAFNLDERARFSDGRPLTATDVEFTFELLKKYGKPFHRTIFRDVTAAIVNPHRIRFDLALANDREVPLILATMPIFSAHATDAERFDKTSFAPFIGSGPYVFKEIVPGERIVLARREDFWAKDLPILKGFFNFDEIRYDFYRDADALFEAFKAGLYDVRVEGDPSRWANGYDIPSIRDGRVFREVLPLRTPGGMNSFVFNTRRALFADPRIREALGLLFDFEWVNKNLFSGSLQRAGSFFPGSDLSSAGHPADARERRFLADFPGSIRPDILEGTWTPTASDGSGRDRDLARRALDLLQEAGWRLHDRKLLNAVTQEPFVFELLVNSRQQERLALNYAASLDRIGVVARVRLVDEVQYWRRLGRFDFDVIQRFWSSSASPGNEQRGRWKSQEAGSEGSLNYAGVNSPAVDRVIDLMLEARENEEFVSRVRTLDRLLLSGFYVVPLYYMSEQWLAYDRNLRHPSTIPLLGNTLDTWWRAQKE